MRERRSEWMTAKEFAGLGIRPTGPEEDFGWDVGLRTRVTFAPSGPDGTGYVYAYDRVEDRYVVLARDITLSTALRAYEAVMTSRTDLGPRPSVELSLDEPVRVSDINDVWMHCVDREAGARRTFESLDIDATTRFEVAQAVMIAKAARVASEDLLVHAVESRDGQSHAPAMVHYRVAGRSDWRGRVAGTSVEDASRRASDLRHLLLVSGFEVEAVSLSHGDVIVPASKLLELAPLMPQVARAGVEI